ncbi:MAG: hypothetical protein J6K01_06045 [Paludibacteraceae bacterium]|jgi:hypothetical protein|nr:hypothetical protein [Paludibacteraceae bacterium]
MKKVLFSLMIALASSLAFTSCSSSDDDIALADIANSTFAAKSGEVKDYNEANPDNQIESYQIVFGATDFQLALVQGGVTYSATGTFSVSGNKVVLASSNEDYDGYTFTGDGSKKIVDDLFKVTLKKQ